MKNILIIEDSKTINNIIKKELEKLNFQISQAFRLSEAKQFLSSDNYELIILDLHLPDGEGSELIANIQSLSDTKVVILTSSQDEDLREELFQYGILDYIIKDANLLYSISEIVKVIHSIETTHNEHILIIDDSRFICKQVKTILEPRNYKTSYALCAKDGIKELQNSNYNLLILDMELPDMHGIEVLKTIRQDIRFRDLPIMVLSGTTTPEIVREVLKNGANDILKKPFVFEEFILKVDLWIDYFKKEQLLQEKNHELKFINDNLEKLIYEEVEQNRKKDKIMFQQSRQAQMGEMIAMIAHQWRQPLNVISTASTVIQSRAEKEKLDKESSKKLTDKIFDNLEYLSSTINDFRDFFKPEKKMQITNFDLIVQKSLNLAKTSLEANHIKLSVIKDSTQEFLSYENELVQVILNILKNAEDVLIHKKIHKPYITITIQGKSVEIQDNGGGIDKKILDRIFDPYFSTKLEREGTGLGLYMSKIIVQEHCKGDLHVQNKHNGALFCINLNEEKRDDAN
jgi:DNA-binding response OmpR family regulator